MNSKNFGQRAGRALTFLAGQMVIVFLLVMVVGTVYPAEIDRISDLGVAAFAVSVYYFGFLVGPIMLIVLVVFDNRAWVRAISAFLPIGFGGAGYIATIYVQNADGRALLNGESLLGVGWLLVSVVILLAYNRLFGLSESRVWR